MVKILLEAVVKVIKEGWSAATRVGLTLFFAGFQKQILVDRPSFHPHYPGPSQKHPGPGLKDQEPNHSKGKQNMEN
jgi:hypothetical protein